MSNTNGKESAWIKYYGRIHKPPRFLTLEAVLQDFGAKHSVCFTLELDSRGQYNTDITRKGYLESEIEAIKNVDDFVAYFRGTRPEGRIIRDPGNPRILHVVDAALPTDNYIMDKRVSLIFKGSFRLLVDKLAKSSAQDLWMSERPTTRGVWPEEALQANINCTEVTYRDVLSDSIPLGNRDGILWTSEYRQYNNKPSISIRLVERSPQPASRPTTQIANPVMN